MGWLGTPLHGARLREAFARVDLSGDGEINVEEFEEWWKSDFHALRRVYAAIDADGSGRIDMHEFASVLRRWGVKFSRYCTKQAHGFWNPHHHLVPGT